MRRLLIIGGAALGLLPAVALGAAGPRVVLPVTPLESTVVAELNLVRLSHGLRPLRPNAALTASADEHSREMVVDGFFAHESADGTPFWARIQRHYGRGTSGTWLVGENLLWAANRVTARQAVRAWLRSPGHRENVLRRRYREVGVSALRAVTAPGVFGNRRVVVLTVDFGVR